MAGGFLLVGRQNHTEGLVGASRPGVPLSKEEIHLRFRGIDGEPWPNKPANLDAHLINGLLPDKKAAAARKYYETMAAECLCDLLFIEPFTHMGGESEIPRDFVFLGFDFGFFQVTLEYSAAQSRIYTEVLFGEHEELREMASELNEHLLFKENRVLKLFARNVTRLMSTGNFEMSESSLGQGFAVHGLPSAQRLITKRFYQPPSFME